MSAALQKVIRLNNRPGTANPGCKRAKKSGNSRNNSRPQSANNTAGGNIGVGNHLNNSLVNNNQNIQNNQNSNNNNHTVAQATATLNDHTRPQSAADLQRRVNQLEAMLDMQRDEYTARVERWDQIIAKNTKLGQKLSEQDHLNSHNHNLFGPGNNNNFSFGPNGTLQYNKQGLSQCHKFNGPNGVSSGQQALKPSQQQLKSLEDYVAEEEQREIVRRRQAAAGAAGGHGSGTVVDENPNSSRANLLSASSSNSMGSWGIINMSTSLPNSAKPNSANQKSGGGGGKKMKRCSSAVKRGPLLPLSANSQMSQSNNIQNRALSPIPASANDIQLTIINSDSNDLNQGNISSGSGSDKENVNNNDMDGPGRSSNVTGTKNSVVQQQQNQIQNQTQNQTNTNNKQQDLIIDTGEGQSAPSRPPRSKKLKKNLQNLKPPEHPNSIITSEINYDTIEESFNQLRNQMNQIDQSFDYQNQQLQHQQMQSESLQCQQQQLHNHQYDLNQMHDVLASPLDQYHGTQSQNQILNHSSSNSAGLAGEELFENLRIMEDQNLKMLQMNMEKQQQQQQVQNADGAGAGQIIPIENNDPNCMNNNDNSENQMQESSLNQGNTNHNVNVNQYSQANTQQNQQVKLMEGQHNSPNIGTSNSTDRRSLQNDITNQMPGPQSSRPTSSTARTKNGSSPAPFGKKARVTMGAVVDEQGRHAHDPSQSPPSRHTVHNNLIKRSYSASPNVQDGQQFSSRSPDGPRQSQQIAGHAGKGYGGNPGHSARPGSSTGRGSRAPSARGFPHPLQSARSQQSESSDHENRDRVENTGPDYNLSGRRGNNQQGPGGGPGNNNSSRPGSAAPTRNRHWVPGRPKTAPSNGMRLARQDESYNALANLQAMFKKVFEENQVLIMQKTEAEDSLKEFLSTTEGHQGKQISQQREQIKAMRGKLQFYEDETVRSAQRAKRYKSRATEEEMFRRQAFIDIECLREVTLELQKINLELTESPQIKIIEQKLYKFQKGLTTTAKTLTENNERHTAELQRVWERVEGVSGRVEELCQMTEKLKEERAEAGKLLKIGKQRIKECKETLKLLQEQFQKLKARSQDTARNYQILLKRQDEESSKISAMKDKFKEILEEVVGNNKFYKRKNEDLQKENEQLKRENDELVESLMAYLMLNQQSSNIKGALAPKALKPLAKMAHEKRVAEPVFNNSGGGPGNNNDDDDDDEDARAAAKHKNSLAFKEYPMPEPIELPQPPDPELRDPRFNQTLVKPKDMPVLLSKVGDIGT